MLCQSNMSAIVNERSSWLKFCGQLYILFCPHLFNRTQLSRLQSEDSASKYSRSIPVLDADKKLEVKFI